LKVTTVQLKDSTCKAIPREVETYEESILISDRYPMAQISLERNSAIYFETGLI